MIYVITDTHFNHVKKMIEYCDRPTDYEQKIWKGLGQLKQGDILIHLGDVCIGKDEAVHAMISLLPCKKWLVLGNHDKKTLTWYLEHGWDWVGTEMVLEYGGEVILFSHQAQEIGHVNTPRNSKPISFNVHGHFHNTSHRNNEPHIASMLTPQHLLLALEYDGYQPLSLDTVINKYRRSNVNTPRNK